MHTLPATAALALALLCQAVHAAPDSDAAERARIDADRQAVEQHFEAAQRDCAARFLVNDCLDRARQARRLALEPLQRQMHLLDDARRRARAVERLRSIQARESAAAAKPALAPSAAAPAASAAARAGKTALQRAVRPAPAASAAAQAAQQRQAQQQQRLQEAQAHQQAVQARNAKRDAQRKPAASLPLPVPGAPAP